MVLIIESNYLIDIMWLCIMGKYMTDLDVKRLPDKNGKPQWKLISDLYYKSSTVGRIVVPEGFITDFASVPRMPIIYLLFGGCGDKEAVLHDWLYTAPHDTGFCKVVDRPTADKVLRGARYSAERIDLSEYEQVTLGNLLHNTWAFIGAWCFWAAVRVRGWKNWEK